MSPAATLTALLMGTVLVAIVAHAVRQLGWRGFLDEVLDRRPVFPMDAEVDCRAVARRHHPAGKGRP
jgi:hypothetical protein